MVEWQNGWGRSYQFCLLKSFAVLRHTTNSRWFEVAAWNQHRRPVPPCRYSTSWTLDQPPVGSEPWLRQASFDSARPLSGQEWDGMDLRRELSEAAMVKSSTPCSHVPDPVSRSMTSRLPRVLASASASVAIGSSPLSPPDHPWTEARRGLRIMNPGTDGGVEVEKMAIFILPLFQDFPSEFLPFNSTTFFPQAHSDISLSLKFQATL